MGLWHPFVSKAQQNYSYARARRYHNPFMMASANRRNAESNLLGGYSALPARRRPPKFSSLARWGS
jgi:hypothetical protein